MRIGEETKLQAGTVVLVLEVSGSGRGHLRGKIGVVTQPYAGHPADRKPIAGVRGRLFGANLYSGDVVEIVRQQEG